MTFAKYGLCTLAAVVIYGLPLALPHYFKSFYRLSDSQVPPELDNHIRKVAFLMGYLPNQVANLNVFITREMESISFGHLASPWGAYVGLPRQVLWTCEDDVKNSTIHKKGLPIDWESDFGRRLTVCLTPTGSQTNFRIAHELAHLKSNHLLYFVMITPLHLMTLFLFLQYGSPFLQRKLNVGSLGVGMGAVCMWAITLVVDMRRVRHKFEFEADKTAACVGRGFAEGGLEMFFRQRQISLLLGDDNEKSTATHPSCLDRQKKLQEVMIDEYQVTLD